MSDAPTKMNIFAEVKPDISVAFTNSAQNKILCHINLQFKTVIFYELKNKKWDEIIIGPITELEQGLCYWSSQDNKWISLNCIVQKAYSDYVSEKELLA